MYVRKRDCRKKVHTVVALSNSEGQTAGGTRERQQRRALATAPEGAGRVGVTKKAEKLQRIFFLFSLLGQEEEGGRTACGREISSWVGYPGGSSSGCLMS